MTPTRDQPAEPRLPAPAVSVVIGAYNAAATLARALDSLLTQEGVDFEVIVVNDGSRDATGAMLDDYARRDPRVRPIHQENQGLTAALARGCGEALGEFIARQDMGDISRPGRLRAQWERARKGDHPVLIAVGCRCFSPEGDLMYEVIPPEDDGLARRQILADGRALCHHGAILFRRDAYQRVGGYRPVFYYSQDIDLLLRLAESGTVAGLTGYYYDFEFSPCGISGQHRDMQLRFYEICRDAQRARAAGRSEAPCLAAAAALRAQCLQRRTGPGKRSPAEGYFFIASCLRRTMPDRARHYYRLAWRNRPLSPRYAVRFLLSLLTRRAKPGGSA